MAGPVSRMQASTRPSCSTTCRGARRGGHHASTPAATCWRRRRDGGSDAGGSFTKTVLLILARPTGNSFTFTPRRTHRHAQLPGCVGMPMMLLRVRVFGSRHQACGDFAGPGRAGDPGAPLGGVVVLRRWLHRLPARPPRAGRRAGAVVAKRLFASKNSNPARDAQPSQNIAGYPLALQPPRCSPAPSAAPRSPLGARRHRSVVPQDRAGTDLSEPEPPGALEAPGRALRAGRDRAAAGRRRRRGVPRRRGGAALAGRAGAVQRPAAGEWRYGCSGARTPPRPRALAHATADARALRRPGATAAWLFDRQPFGQLERFPRRRSGR